MVYPLLTARLSIEPLSENDLGTFVSYRQDPEIARFQSWDTTYSKKQAQELLAAQVGVLFPEPGLWLQLAIHDRASGELLGDLALNRMIDEQPKFEVGFTLAKSNQGQGYAREALGRLIEYLFEEMSAQAIMATCDERNRNSVRLLESLGFQYAPEKSWTEFFKNEIVKVEYYELRADNLGRKLIN
jgi:aminoglycoside 6'-N-acetyltransferase